MSPSSDDRAKVPSASIAGIAAYTPAYRLTSEAVADAWGQFQAAGIESTAVPDGDEDTLTMAAEAGAMAIRTADVDTGAVGGLVLATTTPPYEEESLCPRLGNMLGLPERARTRQLTGSTRCGVDAVLVGQQLGGKAEGEPQVDDANENTTREFVLVIASDEPRGAHDEEFEHAGGAGAVALVLETDSDGDTDGSIRDSSEYTTPTPGTRFRPRGEEYTTGLGITDYDRSAYLEAVSAAVDGLEESLEDVDALALQAPNGKLPYRACGPLGVDSDLVQRATTVHEHGDTGTASPLFGLAKAIDAGHEDVAVVGYGSGGGAGALRVTAGDVPVALDVDGVAELTYSEYLRLRGDLSSGEPEGGGGYVSVPSWRRTIDQRHRLVAGRCRDCGALAFPPSGSCRECGTLDAYDDIELPGTGTVEAVTVIGQGGAPPEFVEQQARSGSYVSAIVAFDGPEQDESVSIPTQVVTVGDESVEIGDRVETTIRRIYTQEAVTRYGFKARLLS